MRGVTLITPVAGSSKLNPRNCFARVVFGGKCVPKGLTKPASFVMADTA